MARQSPWIAKRSFPGNMHGPGQIGRGHPCLILSCSKPLEPSPDLVRCLQEGFAAMKKLNRVSGLFVLLIMIAVISACASTSKQESTGDCIDDSVITTKVKSQLAADDFLKSFQISVETYKSNVQLSGFVASKAAVDKAGEIARNVNGVKLVKNDLIVK